MDGLLDRPGFRREGRPDTPASTSSSPSRTVSGAATQPRFWAVDLSTPAATSVARMRSGMLTRAVEPSPPPRHPIVGRLGAAVGDEHRAVDAQQGAPPSFS